MAATNGPAHGRAGTSREDGDAGAERVPSLVHSVEIDSSSQALRAAAFWAAVVLPFLHVPLLTTGLATPAEQQAFAALLVANAAALYLGHGYGPE